MYIRDFANNKLVLPDLPFSKKELEPFMSEETLNYHYGKHHKAYVDKALMLLNMQDGQEVNIIDAMKGTTSDQLIFNLSQVLNHNMLWLCLQNEINSPKAINLLFKHFGSYEKFCEEFIRKGIDHQGSGWIWLLSQDEKWWITTSSNGNIPLEVFNGHASIITMTDLWEHAYYIDYRNERKKYLEIFTKHLMKLHI